MKRDLPARVVRLLGADDYERRAPRRARTRQPGAVDPLTRGFELACMMRDGIEPTAPLIRQRFRVSAATAKRDRRQALRLARQNPPKAAGSEQVAARREIPGFTSRFDKGLLPDTRMQVKGRRRNA